MVVLTLCFSKVCEFRQPSELKEILSYLPIKEKPTSNTELLEACRDVIKYSVKTSKLHLSNADTQAEVLQWC